MTGTWKNLSIGYDDALARLPEALKKEGFGVITEIDIQATFKAKLGVDSRRYRILGACNPTFAHQAVTKDPQIGVLLPCNVVLYETDEGKAVLGAVDPMQTLGAAGLGEALAEIAREVGARLARVLDAFPTA
ncbi:MAG: DUF302 domain-containing protein [Polyangiaceae bacterium]|nr:DUF302 domain-containing protein [Polyangiaceae bacterium]